MRTITVTGGFSGTAVVDLVDSLAALAGSVFKYALVPQGTDDPPVVGHADWKDPTGTPTAKRATLGALVDDDYPEGYYNLAIDVVKDGRHEVVWATDRPGSTRRALISVRN